MFSPRVWWATFDTHPARTTEAVRRAIQQSEQSMTALAERHGIDRKTVAKWKRRSFAHDAAMGPKRPRSTSLTPEEEATVVAFRQHTLLPLDDCLYALQASIPHLTRSSLHRCLQRHGLSRLTDVRGGATKKRAFKEYPIGYVHIDIAEVRTEEGKGMTGHPFYLFVAIDRTSKVCYAELHKSQRRAIAVGFLVRLLKRVPYRIHTVLTDNGIQFTHRQRDRYAFMHLFDRVCYMHGVEHRLTKPNHPWTNGQVERMNRTLKEATVKRYHYASHAELREHLKAYLLAYNYAKRLKTLRGLTPYEFICQEWTRAPDLFDYDPVHYTPGPYT